MAPKPDPLVTEDTRRGRARVRPYDETSEAETYPVSFRRPTSTRPSAFDHISLIEMIIVVLAVLGGVLTVLSVSGGEFWALVTVAILFLFMFKKIIGDPVFAWGSPHLSRVYRRHPGLVFTILVRVGLSIFGVAILLLMLMDAQAKK